MPFVRLTQSMKNLVAFVRILILTASIVTFYAPTVKAQDIIIKPNYLSDFEFNVLKELNKARTKPKAYARFLEQFASRYIDEKIYVSPVNKGRYPLREGHKALIEAIQVLSKTKELPALQPSKGLTATADLHVFDQSLSGQTGHYGISGSNPFERMEQFGEWLISAGECIQYGFNSPEEVVAFLIIDDGVADRGHRENILNEEFLMVGISHGSHKNYRTITVIDFAGGFIDAERLEAK